MNNTRSDNPQSQAPYLMVEKVGVEQPRTAAVSYRGQVLVYDDLNKQANKLARYLIHLGLMPGSPVALWLDRSPQLLISLLAILKAGGAYVPIDPAYPAERNQFIVEDSGASILLTASDLSSGIGAYKGTTVLLDHQQAWREESENNLNLPVMMNSPAYIMYTSGSTGKPKGVVMSRRTLNNLLQWQANDARLGQPARTLQFTPISFDVSFLEIFSTWVVGGTLVIIDEEIRRDPVHFYDYVLREGIERLYLPYVALQLLATEARYIGQPLDKLKDIVSSGEPLVLTNDIRRLLISLPECRLHNRYGMTECHDVTTYVLPANPANWPQKIAPIGRPIANADVILCDREGNPVPDGDSGELLVCGEAATNGYWRRPELTAARFIDDARSSSGKLYRTGDLASWLPDGNLQLVGREDDQIKIGGNRVELSELEALLRNQAGVRESVVVAVGDSARKRLIAYIMPEPSLSVGRQALHATLRRHVPHYMLPAKYIFLEKIPLTPSGKIDRHSLANRAAAALNEESDLAGPRTAVERILLQIWHEVFQTADIGIYDSFIDLDGQSLHAMQILSRVNGAFLLRLSVKILSEAPTVSALAAVIMLELARDE